VSASSFCPFWLLGPLRRGSEARGARAIFLFFLYAGTDSTAEDFPMGSNSLTASVHQAQVPPYVVPSRIAPERRFLPLPFSHGRARNKCLLIKKLQESFSLTTLPKARPAPPPRSEHAKRLQRFCDSFSTGTLKSTRSTDHFTPCGGRERQSLLLSNSRPDAKRNWEAPAPSMVRTSRLDLHASFFPFLRAYEVKFF